MGRSGTEKSTRTSFFLYIDEFQNFATETFSEILSEARKYWLWLIVAHQFLHQISTSLSHALFGNVGTLVSFRISAEDARVMVNHFDPYVGSYDLANLGAREAYAKMLVRGQVRDPLSIKTRYVPDIQIDPQYIESLYQISRSKYTRSLREARRDIVEKKSEIEKIDNFAVPIL